MDKQDLIPLVEKVAELRNEAKLMADQKNLLDYNMKHTPEGEQYERICNDIEKLSEDLMVAERELKEMAIVLYEETKEKKPIDKVEIKIFKKIKYDLVKALAWCRENAPSLLIVNKKRFEKMAVELGAPVEVKEEARCAIGTDLSAYLKKTEEVKKNE